MSDYLSTLAARSLRREPACQPRRAQMFEPRRETPDSPFVEEARQGLPATETFERGAAEAPPAPRTQRAPAIYDREQGTVNEPRAQAHDHPALAPSQVEGDTSDSHASPRSAEAARPFATPRTLDSSRGALHSEATDEPPAPHAQSDLKVIPKSPPRAPSPVDVQTDEVAGTARPQLPSRRSSSNSETQTAPPSGAEAKPPALPSSRRATGGMLVAEVFDEGGRERAPAVVRREAAESKGALTVADAEVIPPSLPQTPRATPSTDVRPLTQVRPVTAQSATPNATAREAYAQAQPPTIEVTIGRIEVRAVTPPAPPPPRQRQSPPKMSLDDYLRAQSGGRR